MSDKSNEAPALPGEVWRSPVTPDGSIYAVVRLDDGKTLAARLWIGDAWVGVMVSRWLLEGIATERARAERCAEAGRAWQEACERLDAAMGTVEIAEAAHARDEAAAACVNACADLVGEIDTAAQDDA